MISNRDKVTSGQEWKPPTAALHNAWTDAAILAQPQLLGERDSFPPVGAVSILVDTSNTVEAGIPVGYGVPVVKATSSETSVGFPIFEIANLGKERWGVPVDGISSNSVGPVTIRGIVWALVDVLNANHGYAEVSGNVVATQTSPGYARIVYKPTGLGLKWCVLHLGWSTVAQDDGNPLPDNNDYAKKDELCCLVENLIEAGALKTSSREETVRDCTGCQSDVCEFCSGATPERRQLNVFGVSSIYGATGLPRAVIDSVRNEINGSHVLTQSDNDPCHYAFGRSWTVEAEPTSFQLDGRYQVGVGYTYQFHENRHRAVLAASYRTTFAFNPSVGLGAIELSKGEDATYDCSQTIPNVGWTTRNISPQGATFDGWGGPDFRGANVTALDAPATPPPIGTLFATLAEVPAASNYTTGEEIRVVNDGANNGIYLATGIIGSTASAITKV